MPDGWPARSRSGGSSREGRRSGPAPTARRTSTSRGGPAPGSGRLSSVRTTASAPTGTGPPPDPRRLAPADLDSPPGPARAADDPEPAAGRPRRRRGGRSRRTRRGRTAAGPRRRRRLGQDQPHRLRQRHLDRLARLGPLQDPRPRLGQRQHQATPHSLNRPSRPRDIPRDRPRPTRRAARRAPRPPTRCIVTGRRTGQGRLPGAVAACDLPHPRRIIGLDPPSRPIPVRVMETRRPRRTSIATLGIVQEPTVANGGPRIDRRKNPRRVETMWSPRTGSPRRTPGLAVHGLGRAARRLALAVGRLPGGIRGHDVALGQVHARRRPVLRPRPCLPLGEHAGGHAAGADAGDGDRASRGRAADRAGAARG